MKIINGIIVLTFIALTACNVEKTEEGEVPEMEVDVKTESGELPEYEVNWADVDVGTKTKTIEVPKVVVVMEEEQAEIPYLNMQIPDSKHKSAERTIKVEVELSETMHNIDIEKVYANKNRLIVISELESENQSIQDNKVRISDQIIVNAPDNLSVDHYIVGAQPAGSYNNSYRYINSTDQISDLISKSTLLYES